MTAVSARLEHGTPGRGRLVAVLGGSGFLGRRLVRHLLNHGFVVRAASRHPEQVPPLLGPDGAGLEVVRVDVHDEASVAAALAGVYGVVNAVALYAERGRETFHSVHIEAASCVARLAREAGIKRLVHVSGIGADPASASAYIGARGQGEIAVQRVFSGATIVRPAVMFGRDDAFLTTLARLLRTLPAYPMFGRGRTRLQPVHVEDVAEAIARLLGDAAGAGRPCYELGGPHVYSYAELLRTIAGRIGARARFVPVPFALWEMLALVAELLPGAPLTRNQVALMRHDNVASGDLPGLPELGIEPTVITDVLQAIADGSGRTRR